MAKVLLISLDIIGKSMAGPGIRYYEFAKALCKHHEVVLITPNLPDISQEGFLFAPLVNLRKEIKQAEVVVVQHVTVRMAFWLWLYRPCLILDAYDPIPLEHLEIFKAKPQKDREVRNELITQLFRFSLQAADGILAANSHQKDLWLGFLLALDAVTPAIYDEDSSLSHWLSIVPFGLSDKPLERRMGMREKFGIKHTDTVLLWGGGVWNWFDPLSLIKAIEILSKTRDDIKLVFMGLKHPNKGVPEMQMASDAVELARTSGLLDRAVFFNFGWTPYEERQAFLAESDIGVSLHFDQLETHYAFRTRILDYLWAGLPIISTTGDSFADLIQIEGAGIEVTFKDTQAIVAAILKIKSAPESYQKGSRKLADSFKWSKISEPLDKMITHLAKKKAKGVSLLSLLNYVFQFIRKKILCRLT